MKNKNDIYVMRGLTEMEIEIVGMLSIGLNIDDVSEQAEMSRAELKLVMSSIYQKLEVKSLAQLIVLDLRLTGFLVNGGIL